MSAQSEATGLPRTHVPRPQLLDKLALATQGRLTIVCGNAGYGKTTLLSEFAASAGWRSQWHYLTPADRDVTRLAEGLEACLRRLGPTPEAKVPRKVRVRQTGAASPTALSEMLLRLVAGIGSEPVLLVLDDFHNVDGSAGVNSLLSALIEGGPASLRFVVLSRSVPHLLTRLKARQEASILEEKTLAFTLGETSRFLRIESQLDLDDDEIALVHDRTEGWAAGIAMVAQSLRYSDQKRVMAVLADPVASAWLVYDYLAEEVFDRQEASVQKFLTTTSILSTMNAPVCDYLLRSSSSQRTLLALEERGLFTTSADLAKLTFRYHPLFLEFLRQKLYQLETRDSVEALHRLAGEHYERQGEWEECIHHYLKAGEPMRAATAIERIGERYIFSGFSQTVEHWLRGLPEEVSSGRPRLLALRGRLSNMSGRYEDALRTLERSLRLFRAEGNTTGEAWTTGEIAYVRFRLGEIHKSIRDFSIALSVVKDEPDLRSQLLIMQAMAYRDAGMIEQSLAGCHASLEELSGVADEATRLWGQCRVSRNLAMAQMEKGQVEDAVASARGALAFCAANQIGGHEESWVLASLGATLWASGEFEESVLTLNRALSLSSGYAHNLHLFVAPWLGNAHRDAGRYEEADRAYGQGGVISNLERVFCTLQARGKVSTVKGTLADLYRAHKDSESLLVRSTAELVYSAGLRKEQDAARALEHAREAVRLLKASGYGPRVAGALFHQSRIEYDLSRIGDAKNSLSAALEIADAGGYRHLFWWDEEVVAFLCAKAIAENICPDYAAELAVRRLDSASAVSLVPLLQDKRSEVRQRAQAVLSTLPQRGSHMVRDEILADCPDPRVRESLLRAIAEGLISAEGVRSLRTSRSLSWREVEILVEYYLRPALGLVPMSGQLRKECAQRLSISEYTVRCHVNSIRTKLALPAWVSGSRVLDWAREEGILPS